MVTTLRILIFASIVDEFDHAKFNDIVRKERIVWRCCGITQFYAYIKKKTLMNEEHK